MSRSPAKSTLNNMSVKKPDYESKIVLAGDTDVGKSQIINRIVKGSFSDNPQATIGIEYGYRKMTV
jgi:GTPase SAR1 family protein